MSFSSELKAEIARIPFGEEDERIAELSGFAHAAGAVSLYGRGALGLVLRTDHAFIARRLFLSLKGMGNVPQLLSSRRENGPRAYRVVLIPPDAGAVLAACSMLDAQGRPLLRAGIPAAQTRRTRQRRAYIRGAFLGSGSLADPASGYHAEWGFARETFAGDFAGLLIRMALSARRLTRGDRHIVYLKGADDLAALLGLMGASAALFDLENTRVVKTVRNQVNRQVNAEAANLDKAATAAARQIAAIKALQASPRWQALDPALRDLAEARLRLPDAPLGELACSLDPPLSKSGVSHRMRRLMAYAGESSPQPGTDQVP